MTKLGYPYGDDLSFRYVEITPDDTQLRHRYFYVEPLDSITVGDHIHLRDVIGTVQDISSRYDGMSPHIHFEILDKQGEAIDPTEVVWPDTANDPSK